MDLEFHEYAIVATVFKSPLFRIVASPFSLSPMLNTSTIISRTVSQRTLRGHSALSNSGSLSISIH